MIVKDQHINQILVYILNIIVQEYANGMDNF